MVCCLIGPLHIATVKVVLHSFSSFVFNLDPVVKGVAVRKTFPGSDSDMVFHPIFTYHLRGGAFHAPRKQWKILSLV